MLKEDQGKAGGSRHVCRESLLGGLWTGMKKEEKGNAGLGGWERPV